MDIETENIMLKAEINRLHHKLINNFGSENNVSIRQLEEQIEMMKCCANCKTIDCNYEKCTNNGRKYWMLRDMRM